MCLGLLRRTLVFGPPIISNQTKELYSTDGYLSLGAFAGTTKIKNLDNNIESLRVKLTIEDIKEISDLIPMNAVAGSRISDALLRCSWNFADTPPNDGQS